ncbi:DUF6879 family protein [Actinocorallia sp. A-T 12471]|uniref:DUF6879 family protein n=1 Tax=Actinocorallia sp. A-T 12471 TaxID=3089813 RepID=UPI0029CE8E0A|nr:DUF6879 family protein [Actinocorallia sp. A-T 12471]MDX6743260.1 hypothetical protein [Actinocorallia sp. A-T 12471]
MRPIDYQEFQNRVRASRRAWHLELRDSYHVEEEGSPIQKWRNGEPDDFEWLAEWLSFVADVTRSGVRIERLRIKTVPHSEYAEWNLSASRRTSEAGEEIRYLPRHLASDLELLEDDCWLPDDSVLILSLFQPDGRTAGFAISDDADLLARYRDIRDRTWSRGTPIAEYARW